MTVHLSVLLHEVVDSLLPPLKADALKSGWLVDCTLGGGGHTSEFLKQGFKVIGIDRDPVAVGEARERFQDEIARGQFRVENVAISEVAPLLEGMKILGVLADLGFSSDQIETRGRGFSFLRDEPLDMRMNPDAGESAYEWLSKVSEKDLADCIFEYGEERFSRRIARAIVESRGDQKLPTTSMGLAKLIEWSVPPPYRRGRIHPATRSFQAIRIHVNGEMEQLDALLNDVILKLSPGGRMGIISFHSLEDRKVKHRFKDWSLEGFEIVTKKPIEATEEEMKDNPRSRSAKYRVIERVK